MKRGELLRQTIAEKGMKCSFVASWLKVTPQTLSKWFKGEPEISDDKLMQACALLNVDIERFGLYGTNPYTP